MPRRTIRIVWANLAVVALIVTCVGNSLLFFHFRSENNHRVQEVRNLTLGVQTQSLMNCSTVNKNTKQVYQVALAFQAIVRILEQQIPGADLHANVTEPKYLPCVKKR